MAGELVSSSVETDKAKGAGYLAGPFCFVVMMGIGAVIRACVKPQTVCD
jgi:hypothetical protein